MKYLAWVVSIATFVLTVPGTEAQPLENGARVAGTGGAGAATSGALALRLNPASIGYLPGFIFIIGYSRAYGLPELDHYQAALGKQVGAARIAVAIESFGFESFRQQGLHAVWAVVIRELDLSLGVAFSAERVAIPGTESSKVIRNGVGAIVRLRKHLHVGASLRRLFQIGSAPQEGRLLVVGGSLRATPQLLIVMDAMKDARFPISMRGGIELLPVPVLALRGGVSTAPESISLGVGIDTGVAKLDVAANRHSTLGWSRAVSMSIEV